MDNKIPEDLQKERKLLRRKIRTLTNEYRAKVSYDFSRYIYVGVKENFNICTEDAINFISKCAGYQEHRMVYYKHRIATNMFVRFEDENYASAAISRLLQQEGYCADMVSAMLISLYLEEMIKGNFPWTLAVVNIEGRADLANNPLSQDVLRGMLMQFGDPRINTYQNGFQVEHVQVLFSSMSEALGASIAHGPWRREFEKPMFYYNIQIMGSEKEATILRAIQPNKQGDEQELDAFELDYFVQKMEIKTTPSYMGSDSCLPNPIEPPQDFRNSPRTREFRRQYSRSRGNNRGRGGNTQWRKYQNHTSQTIPLQGISNLQN